MHTTTDNIFRDLGFSEEDAAHLKARSALMMTLERFIKDQGWRQVEAAEFFGVTQPDISDLVRGKIMKFSLDKLVDLVAKTDREVSLRISGSSAVAEVA